MVRMVRSRDGDGTRRRIKKSATDFLIRKGFRGTSYGDIAASLKTTTTNIHYHFGPKHRLVEEVVSDYVDAALERQRVIWLDEARTLTQKLEDVVAMNRDRHRQFNRGGVGSSPWSLIGRLRLEIDVLTQPSRDALARFSTELHDYVRIAVRQALQRGELRADCPDDDITFLVTNLVNTSSTFSQDLGSFDRLEMFFETVSRVITSAYACSAKGSDTN